MIVEDELKGKKLVNKCTQGKQIFFFTNYNSKVVKIKIKMSSMMPAKNVIVKPEKLGLLRLDIDHHQRYDTLLETGAPSP